MGLWTRSSNVAVSELESTREIFLSEVEWELSWLLGDKPRSPQPLEETYPKPATLCFLEATFRPLLRPQPVFRAATTTKRAGSRAQHRGNVPIPSVWKIDRKLSTREILSQNKSDRSSK
ncbi:uncharacterized protein MCYG_05822 [Microsporum canis CBS 113480]|uniref:Uncharacterized protein n=1 Tax=Arthroderma otae (strain ATCC MYA-4605 / CBS 113480) TaxID=554155 RepID=C5FT00_ARTOC|nr:uncharacterized protein MCYG_05822 [Microsporum canis CBS 113480]EEQ33003.1 predicted protein [Microsporum canis CBS 113480]